VPHMTEDDTDYDEEYYRANGQLGDRPALGYYVRLVRRYIGKGPYLDFGCGTGHLLRRLSQIGSSAGFEVSEFSAARARATAAGCEVSTSMGDLRTAAYSGLTAIHVLEHLEDPVADLVLQTWTRVLAPGGRALVVMPDPSGRARRLHGADWLGFSDATHINLKPHGEWKAFIEDRGFRVVKEGSDGLWNSPYSQLPRLADAALRSGPALAQYLVGRVALRPGSGESSIFILEKR
jgi:SAM-dependent methyltransferase